jgi:hypothetical protein
MQSTAASLDDRHHFRQLCQLARDAFAADPEDCWADVKEAIKCRCARLRIAYGGDIVDRAMAAVVSSTRYRGPQAPAVEPPLRFTRDEASAILATLQHHLGIIPVRSIPSASTSLRRIAQKIQDSITRCEALEAACEPGPVASATDAPIAGPGPRDSVDAPASGVAGGDRVPRCGDD